MFSSDGRVWCWTHNPKELSKWTFIQSVKHGGGFVMIWDVCLYMELAKYVELKVASIDMVMKNF